MLNFSRISVKATIFLASIFLVGLVTQKIHEIQDYNPTVIIESHQFNNHQDVALLKNKSITAEFKSNNNNLGIISTKFDTHYRINNDYLQFSIKEKGQKDWYYSNKYKVDQFQNNKYFPFGFPEIKDSKGKNYQIEIYSLYGTEEDSVSILKDSLFLSKYSFPKSFLLQNKNELLPFLIAKTKSLLAHVNFINYFTILVFSILFLFLSNNNIGKKFIVYIQSSKKNNIKLNDSEKLINWFFYLVLLIVIFASLILLIKKHNESSEWLTYELTTIISFFALIKFNLFNNFQKYKNFKNVTLLGSLVLIFQLIILYFYLNIISLRYLIIASLALLPSIIFYQNKPENFIKIFFINLFSVVNIASYFVLDIDNYSTAQFLLIIISILVVSFLLTKLDVVYKRFFNLAKISKILLSTLFYVLLFSTMIFSVRKSIEYHHYSYYVGPTYEVSLHKSILSQSPSQYGYLSIHFIETLLKPFGVNFNSFHYLNCSLFILYFFGFFLIFKKITKNLFLSVLLTIISTQFQSIFSLDSSILAPSTGPLRFGFGLIIILLFLYLPQKLEIFIPLIFSTISIFWSIETAIYTIPAIIFTTLSNNFINSPNFKNFILKTIKNCAVFLLSVLIIFSVIFVYEYNLTKTLPNVLNYFQFANAYKAGFGSELIPLFGNYYVAISVLLLGITLSIYGIFKKINTKTTLFLNFLSIHNIALFSYFISRSNQNNVVNISAFLLLEIVVSYLFIQKTFFVNDKKRLFYQYSLIPFTIFIVLFESRCILNTIVPSRIHYSNQNTNYYQNQYKLLQSKYNLNPNNVLIISKDNSTTVISDNQINTILPLNPVTMTTLLPDYETKYIIPNLNKVAIGTTLVYTKDMPELMEIFSKYFKLDPVATDSADIYNLYTIKNK